MKSARPPSRFSRVIPITAVLLVLYTVIGFLVVPPVLKSQLQKRLSAELGRTVTVGNVRFNPYALSLTLENFDIRLKEGDGSFVGWNRLYVNFEALASLMGDWVLGEIDLDGFHAATVIKPDGSLNFSDILTKLKERPTSAAPAKSDKPGRPLRIGSLKIHQAKAEFLDQSRPAPFTTVLGPVTFTVTGFRTAGASGAPYDFQAVTESGEKLTWTGTLSAEPFRSVGELSLENIALAKYAPYYADRIQADLVEGKLSVRGKYEVNLTVGEKAAKLSDGSLQLRGLKVLERANQEVAIALPSLDITNVAADARTQKATVGSVILSGGQIRARREKDGAINLLQMLQPANAGQTPASAPVVSSSKKQPDVMVGEVALKDFKVDFNDLAAPSPAQLGLSGIQVSLKNFTLSEGATMPLDLSLGWAPQGLVKVNGEISIQPLKTDLKLQLADFEIRPLTPYLEQFINARITQGVVSTTLAAKVESVEGQSPAATLTGDVKLEQFGLVDSAHNEELAGFGALGIAGLSVTTSPQLKVKIEEIGLVAPYARVVRNKDASLNLAAVAKSAPAATATKEEAPSPVPVVNSESKSETAPSTTAPQIEIAKVVISEGDFSFADRSVEPNVRMVINRFAGRITGLSSENMAKAGVDLKATVDGAGPVSITGQLDPLGAKKLVDLKIDFRNVDLLPLSPYSGKYAGYELARGKLLLDVKFLLDDKKIDATNVVTLNQFTFGGQTKSPDATGLPVRLGVALLKDIDGKIVIDVPIQGSTDDPNFRIGKVVLRVVVNLLTKAAVSPFALLGSMFGGGGDELAYQEFTPGIAALQPAEVKKIETMTKALTNRPGLSLSLEGSYDGPADTYALKRQKFAESVRRAIWDQKHAVSPTIAPPEQLVITPEENTAMVKQLFDAKFAPGTEFGTPLAKAPEAAAPPAAPKKGFFGRVVDTVTFRKLREDKHPSEEKAQQKAEATGDAALAGPSVEEMTGRLAETIEVGDNDLRGLASARAQQVRDYFINVGKIDPERLFLASNDAAAAKTGKGPRVFLSLQ